MKKKIFFMALIGVFMLLLPSVNKAQQKLDEVNLGSFIMAAKPLNVKTFNNGDLIYEAKSLNDWYEYGNSKKPCWAYYQFDSSNGEKYGILYNWFAITDARGIVPKGWHIPSDNEWNTIVEGLGEKEAGSKIKEVAALTGYIGDKVFYQGGENGYYWSSTFEFPNGGWARKLKGSSAKFERLSTSWNNGLSVWLRKD